MDEHHYFTSPSMVIETLLYHLQTVSVVWFRRKQFRTKWGTGQFIWQHSTGMSLNSFGLILRWDLSMPPLFPERRHYILLLKEGTSKPFRRSKTPEQTFMLWTTTGIQLCTTQHQQHR